MKLTKKALKAIDNREARLKLALHLGFSERWIEKCIAANKENGPLTTVAAMRSIIEFTGMDESQVLEQTRLRNAA